jgi:hypothetical protein
VRILEGRRRLFPPFSVRGALFEATLMLPAVTET